MIVSSPKHGKTLSVADSSTPPSATSHHLTPIAHTPTQDFLLTLNSELDPALVSVMPIKSNTGVKATIFHSHSADDQRAIMLHLVPGDQTESFVPDPSRG